MSLINQTCRKQRIRIIKTWKKKRFFSTERVGKSLGLSLRNRLRDIFEWSSDRKLAINSGEMNCPSLMEMRQLIEQSLKSIVRKCLRQLRTILRKSMQYSNLKIRDFGRLPGILNGGKRNGLEWLTWFQWGVEDKPCSPLKNLLQRTMLSWESISSSIMGEQVRTWGKGNCTLTLECLISLEENRFQKELTLRLNFKASNRSPLS